MALKATIFKANINIADMNRNHYEDVQLTLAQHPSESEQRMMLRLLAWICHADERLVFTKGLAADDEPELWRLNDHNEPALWIELGLPDEKRLRKACNQADEVILYAYGDRAGPIWWQQNKSKLSTHKNLRIQFLDDEQMAQLASMAKRSMVIQATLQEDTIWLSDNEQHLGFKFTPWLEAAM